jgi:DNA-binding response OmpR family regulator
MKVLLIEDSPRLQKSIQTGLRKSGFAVDVVGDGKEGLWKAESSEYDVIILDLMLPGLDGLSVLQQLRSKGKKTHILILTAKDTVENRVSGLKSGADDYLVKPFAFEELVARVQALCRRNYSTKTTSILIGDLEIDTSNRSVTRKGHSIELTAREYMLLEYLASRKGQVISRNEIEEHIYDDLADPMSNVVDSAICILRKKLNEPDLPNLIHTRRGMGYLLEERSA